MANYANQKRVINIKDEVERTRPQKENKIVFVIVLGKQFQKLEKCYLVMDLNFICIFFLGLEKKLSSSLKHTQLSFLDLVE